MTESLCNASAVTKVGKELGWLSKRPEYIKNNESTLERYSCFSVNNDSFTKFKAATEFPAGSAPS